MLEKKYNADLVEAQMLELWQKNQTYAFHKDSGKEIYSIDTPPPTVSGSLHIGHIFSYTQAEMIARFRRMQGYEVFYPFGFDDNGLPTERLVEKEDGILAKDFSRSDFEKKCLKTTLKYEKEFRKLWDTLGFSCDWQLQYTTVSQKVQRISQRSFLDLVKQGKAYAKDSPVLWCTQCQTSIAQAELESKEMDSYFNYINFSIGDTQVLVATTRPELLYGVVCLFVNPGDERYQHYIGKKAAVPLYNFEVPVLSDEKVAVDKGTGVVMCATYGDSTDVEWCGEYQLPYKKVINADGTIDKEVPYIGGKGVIEARKHIVMLLDEKGYLVKSEKMSHMVAVHERCGKDVEIIPSKQWYIDVLTEKERFLKAGDAIKWYPKSMKTRYVSWVENLKWDWCISRQRYFGVPFPVWYCKNCDKPHFADAQQLPVNPLETDYKGVCSCGGTEFYPETAVFDTWATSSVTPQINARFGEADDLSDVLLPMSMRTQAHEIIRTWAFYTIVKSLYHTGEIPWKEIMICGFVLAKKGEKISKSKGNSDLSPQNLIKTYSADVLRYWAANARLGTDTFFGTEELVLSKRFVTKLWNAAKFAIMHLEDYTPGDPPILLPIDKWMIEKTNQSILEASNYLYQYEIGSARHVIDDLFWKDLCDNYLEIVKDRLYKPEIHGESERKSGQYALYYSLFAILKAYAIYVPHITEYIYQQFFLRYETEQSIHTALWHVPQTPPQEDLLAFGESVKEVIAEMRKYKSENNLSMRTELDKLEIKANPEYRQWYQDTEKDLIACANAKEIVYL